MSGNAGGPSPGSPWQPGPPRLARAVFAVAVCAFPAAVRARFGDAMRETLADRWAEPRAVGVQWLLLPVWLADVIRAGLLERLRLRSTVPVRNERARREPVLGSIGTDIRLALRGLRSAPTFTLVAVITLATGIGATTTIFSVLEGVLLRPWPFPESSELVVVQTTRPATGDRWTVNYADYEDWRDAGVFESVSVFWNQSADMAAPGGDPERVAGIGSSADYFATLGLSPMLGRLPTAEEYSAEAQAVTVLSYAFWRSRFAADPGMVGTTIRLSGTPHTVIGVLSPEADVLEASFFVPLRLTAEASEAYRDRDNFMFQSVARLKEGSDLATADAAVRTVAARIERDYSALREGTSAAITPLSRWVAGDDLSRILWVAFGSVALVLLIGCANLANLLLARGVRREREMAVRAALGAGRARLVRQLLVESGVLALLGGAAGVLLSFAAVRAITTRAPDNVPRLDSVGINVQVLGFALVLSAVAALIFGLMPAIRSTATEGARALADRGTAGDGGIRGRRWRSALVVTEVALTVVLLAGAGLMIRSLRSLMDIDPGFDTTNVLTFAVSLPAARYSERPVALAAQQELRERVAAIPGIEAVAQASQLPLGAGATGYLTRAYLPEGGAEPPAGTEVIAPWEVVTPGYFDVLRHPIRRGRDFASTDTYDSPLVMIVNHEFARQMFGDDESALGRRVRSWRDENLYREIVGIVDDVRYYGADDEIRAVAYVPLGQDSRRGLMTIVRTAGDPAALIPQLRSAVRDFDPDLATASFTTMQQAFDRSVAPRRFAASLLATFALLALLLAAIGLYGVLTITVAQRTREFGVRMALGAGAGDVRRMVLRQGAVLVLLGAAAGTLGAMLVTRVLSAVLFGVTATDPATFATAVAVLLVTGLVATWLPALRATRVDPVRAIRSE